MDGTHPTGMHSCFSINITQVPNFGGGGGGYIFSAEIFTKFSSGKHDVDYYNSNPDPNNPGIDYWETVEENFFDIAPGAAIGQKWVNKIIHRKELMMKWMLIWRFNFQLVNISLKI